MLVSGFIAELGESFSFYESLTISKVSSEDSKKDFKEVSNKKRSTAYATSEEDCHESDCHTKSEHCVHHCTGLHNLSQRSFHNTLVVISFAHVSKSLFSYENHYRDPYLNQLIKPPKFS